MIIDSLLDQDFYKFTMGQVVLHRFPAFEATCRFRCRNEGVVWTTGMRDAIAREIDHLCTLRFTFDGVAPLQIVIKLTECNGRPVAKLSDSRGKTICTDEGFLRYLRSVVGEGESA